MQGKLRRLTALGGASALLAGSALIAGPAFAGPEFFQADPQAKGDYKGDPNFTGPTSNGERDAQGGEENAIQFGAYIPTGGQLEGLRVWCIDAGLDWPYADGYAKGKSTSEKAPELSYILAKWDKERSNQADQMSYDMAISEHVHLSDEIPHRNLLDARTVKQITDGVGWNDASKNIQKVGKSKFYDSVVPDAIKHSSEMQKEAEKYATDGDYSVKVDVKKDRSSDEGTATVTLVNSKGTAVPGFDGTLKVEGAEAEQTELTSGTKGTTVKLSDFEGGQAKVSATFKGLPTGSVTLHQPKDFKGSDYDRYNLQQIIQKEVKTVSSSDTMILPSSPSVTTKASTEKITSLPATVHDVGATGDCYPGSDVTIRTNAYFENGRIERSESIPEDAQELGEQEQEFVCGDDGKIDYKTDDFELPADLVKEGEHGEVTFVVSVDESEHNNAWTSDYGAPEETVSIEIPEKEAPKTETPKPEKPEAPESPEAPEKPDTPKKVETGAYVEDSGPNMALIIGGGAAALVAIAGAITYFLRRRNSN